ncbi:MAG: hypothetical protein HY834_01110 [Devosia nanyangense]|uniref:DUF5979 domain-containing protein n=1 Tax=Devosia nanyangense TaxID=1228055 RepID=A0A933KZF3_9HYPH|nr:hypothetical protein [Devosia nanyangense]
MKTTIGRLVLAACAVATGLGPVVAIAAQPCGYALYNSAGQTDPALYPPYPTSGCAQSSQPPNPTDPFIPNPSFECPGIPLWAADIGGTQYGQILLDYDPAPGHSPNSYPTPGPYGGNTYSGDNRFVTGWEVRASLMEYARNASDGCYSIVYWSTGGWIWTSISQLQPNSLYDIAFDVLQASHAQPPVSADVALTARVDLSPPPPAIIGNPAAASLTNSLPSTAHASRDYTNSSGFIQVPNAWQTHHLYFVQPPSVFSAILSFHRTSSIVHASGSHALLDNVRITEVPSHTLTVAKAITVAAPATPPSLSLTFATTVACGNVASAPDYDFHQTLAVGQSVPQTVPVLSGATCEVTENPSSIPTGPIPDPACPSGFAEWGSVPAPTTLTVTADQTVTIENTYACVPIPPRLDIQKIVVNHTNADLSDWVFPVVVTCGGQQHAINVMVNHPGIVMNDPVGALCSATEDTQSLDLPPAEKACDEGLVPYWEPAVIAPVTGPLGQYPVKIAVTNTLDCVKPATIRKVVVNNTSIPASIVAGWQFPITALCDGNVVAQPVLANNQSAVVPVPEGSECRIDESPVLVALPNKPCPAGTSPQWTTAATADGYFHSGDTVTVTNTLNCVGRATLTIKKAVVDLTGGYAPQISFGFDVACGMQHIYPSVAGDTTLPVTIPSGVACHVQENNPPAPSHVPGVACTGLVGWVLPPTYAPPGQIVNLPPNGSGLVLVTNTYKCLDGPKAPVCAPGTVLKDGTCVREIVCEAPKIPGTDRNSCVCPAGTAEVNGTCVAPETGCKPPYLSDGKDGCTCPEGMKETENGCALPGDLLNLKLPKGLGDLSFGG